MPLQSKVNDMLMDVYLQRVIRSLHSNRVAGHAMTSELIAEVIEAEGKALGFVVRLEELHHHIGATSVRECLVERPFLFIGYRFHVRDGQVVPYIDIPRALSRLPYNSSFDWLEKQAHSVRTAIRLGGLALSMGIPPQGEERAFAKLVAAARFNLARHVHSAMADKEVAFQMNQLVFVGNDVKYTISDMRGLLNALTKETICRIWAEGVTMDTSEALGDWADAVEAEEAQLKYSNSLEWLQQRSELRKIVPDGRIPGQRPVGVRVLSSTTLGRVPPTIPRERPSRASVSYGGGERARKADHRRGGQLWWDSESERYSEYSDLPDDELMASVLHDFEEMGY